MRSKYSATMLIVLVIVSATDAPLTWSAEACVPPPGFVDTPPPEIAPIGELVSHTEEITIDYPLAVVRESGSRGRLEETIDRTSGLPGVTGTHRLTTEVRFPQPGARRLVCLTDGSIVSEQVLDHEENPDGSRYRYIVWNYTSPKFPPISYAIGEIVRSAVGNTRTQVRWTYSFQLNRQKHPGSLGAEGDRVFRETFLDPVFSQWMRKTLENGKKRVGHVTTSHPNATGRVVHLIIQ